MSFSPQTGLVYIPVNDIGFGYIPPLVAEDAQRLGDLGNMPPFPDVSCVPLLFFR